MSRTHAAPRRFACSCGLFLLVCLSAPTWAAEDSGKVAPNIDVHDLGARFLPRVSVALPHVPGSPNALDAGPGTDVELGGWNESAIAVNPTNPMNIACASLFELRVTTDGGTTWQAAVPCRLPATHVAQGDPSLAFDSEGRLFWSYLGSPLGSYLSFLGIDVFVAQCDPATGAILPDYPVNVTTQIGVPGTAGNSHDKEWLAADFHVGSPFANRLYLVWTRFPPNNIETTLTSYSSDHGLTWSAPLQLGAAGSGSLFIWPTHIAVAPNGDVYAADHRQGAFFGNAPNGVSGFISVFRSTDGGATFPQQTQPFPAGTADMTFNVQSVTGAIPGAKFWLQGSVQPWVLPDPNVAGRIFVVANDDPDNNVGSGDPADVDIARSTDFGATWSAPTRVDHGPGLSLQVMPTAGIDPSTGAIVVTYYDNRNGAVNAQGDYLLDVFATVSLDGGATFAPDFQVSDTPFDPDAGARCRFDCGTFIADVWASSGGQAFAVSSAGHFLTYDGATWSMFTNTASPKFGVWGSSTTDVFLCGSGGQILHYDGGPLVSQPSGTGRDLFGIDGRTGSDVFAVGAVGTVLHYNGSNWSSIAPGTVNDLQEVWVNPTGSVFVVGDLGTVLRYDGSWHDISPGGQSLFGVWGSGDSDVYVSGAAGALYHWNGSSWSPVDLGLAILLGLWGSSASDVFATGFGTVRRYNGSAWSNQDASEHFLFKIHGSGPSNVFAVGENGEIDHFDGTGWTRQANPLSPTIPSKRIGEYNGAAAGGGGSFAVWCGNTFAGPARRDQQAIFDRFDTNWQVGVSLVDLTYRAPRLLLESPRPNPARNEITVAYALPRSATVDLSLVDVQGRRVATLVHETRPAGRHVVSWPELGALDLASGLYLLRLDDGRERVTRRLTLLR